MLEKNQMYWKFIFQKQILLLWKPQDEHKILLINWFLYWTWIYLSLNWSFNLYVKNSSFVRSLIWKKIAWKQITITAKQILEIGCDKQI